jgi:hypothetical protein
LIGDFRTPYLLRSILIKRLIAMVVFAIITVDIDAHIIEIRIWYGWSGGTGDSGHVEVLDEDTPRAFGSAVHGDDAVYASGRLKDKHRAAMLPKQLGRLEVWTFLWTYCDV